MIRLLPATPLAGASDRDQRPVACATRRRQRLDAIDFWRGVSLAIIFVNHMPGNVLGNFTPRNYRFSDAAEAFVFLSGFSVALAYGARFETLASRAAAAAALTRRAARLYGVHIGLTAAALALYGVVVALTGQVGLLAENGRATFFEDPLRGLIGIVTLAHQVGYFNILPLYVAFMAFAPILLTLTLRGRGRMICASLGLYAAARAGGVNAPTWPEAGGWYFNPMTWQFMFALGIFFGLAIRDGRAPIHAGVYRIAQAVVCGAALIVSNVFGLVPGLVDAAGAFLDWDKTQLGVVRILDFLALAYVIHGSGISAKIRETWIYAPFERMGRHALLIYCLGSLLSALGHILKETWTNSPLFDIAFVAVCLGLLHKAAGLAEERPSAAPAAA